MSAAPEAAPVFGATVARLWTRPLITSPAGPCGCGCALTPEWSYGFYVADFAANVLGTPLDPWQRWLVIHAGEMLDPPFAKRRRPRFRTVLVLISRQQGKTHLGVVLTLYWIFIERQRLVLGTSTNRDTAKESWRSAVYTAETCEWLEPLIAKVRAANGEETLQTVDGCRYRIAASNRRGGRGMTINRLILDELREHHTAEAWDAAVPATNAVPDAQIWALTNQGGDDSIILHRLRLAALDFLATGEGDRRLGIFEWSAEDGADPTDVAALAQANPSLGHRTDLETLMGTAVRAKAAGGAELASFRTEIMCQRVNLLDPAVDPAAWENCGDFEPPDLGEHRRRVALCVDVALDGSHVSLVAAAVLEGIVRLEVIAHWDSIAQARREMPAYVALVRPGVVGWFPNGPAAVMAAELQERRGAERFPPRGTKLEEIRAELPAASMGFAELVRSGQVRHPRDDLLTTHVHAAQRQRRGDAWVFGRRDSDSPIDAVYAAAGAAWLTRTMPPPRPELTAL